MKIDLNQFRQTFLLESAENVSAMEVGLLELRNVPDDVDLLNGIFRAAHSIKGGAGSFGFNNLTRFTHALENLLDQLRSFSMPATEDLISLLLRSVDVIRGMLDGDANAATPPDALELEERFAALATVTSSTAEGSGKAAQGGQDWKLKFYQIEFRPDRELFASGTNPILLLRNLAALGTVSVCHLHTEELPLLAELDPAQCYLSWSVELASASSETEIREIFEFVEHLAEIRVTCVDAPETDIETLSERQEEETLQPLASALAPNRSVQSPSAPQATKKVAQAGESGSIRVAIDKVDRLIDLVGELVIAHVMTAQMVEDFEPTCLPKLREAVAAMERSTRELHERVMAVRMLPVGTLFRRYSRTVFDIAQSTGKHIRLETDGEDTEIDKSMLELLGDPLTHLIRNAADHGIESPDLRADAGKDEEGLITLRAFHRAGRIVIEVSDDGAGIDTDRVREKAIERGLISADSQFSDEQVRMLIFEPGFSTSDTVSDLSGRGVGMDVVKRNVQQLNGTIALVSEKGLGSTISIELPLTLAILEGLLVRVGDRTLVLPLLSVIETVPLRDNQIVRVASHGEVVVIREESIPLLRLSRFLGLSANVSLDSSDRKLAVVAQAGPKKIGLVVDELLGQQQVVVKSLEQNLRKIDGLMGATILGDGCVAPIVDVASIATLNLLSLQASTKAVSQTAPMVRPVMSAGFTEKEKGGSAHALV